MLTFFRFIALFEGISYILLLFVATPIKYLNGNEAYVKMLGMPHGLLFIMYLVVAFLLKTEMNWNNRILKIVLISSIIPFGTFYIDKKYLA